MTIVYLIQLCLDFPIDLINRLLEIEFKLGVNSLDENVYMP